VVLEPDPDDVPIRRRAVQAAAGGLREDIRATRGTSGRTAGDERAHERDEEAGNGRHSQRFGSLAPVHHVRRAFPTRLAHGMELLLDIAIWTAAVAAMMIVLELVLWLRARGSR
jgi:hypothetical protein